MKDNTFHMINEDHFNALQDSLRMLDLQRNSLPNFPYWAFTFLRRLQYLRLQGNQIREISANTSAETQLKSLQFLHLDDNEASPYFHSKILCFVFQLTTIHSKSLSSFPLNVLTLSRNQIRRIQEDAFPTPLSFLDLSRNLLDRVSFTT